ncbi:YeeE/YedE thiosulfate transporter family protein [Bacteroidota bacterium]
MTAPFYQFEFFGYETSLLIAFAIDISFGFFLEKGGLGNSVKLAGQFYFTDLTVFKVMFSAIVTAMLGLFLFTWTGFLDISKIDFGQTFVIPYLVAGILFGIGFVIGGLCPGTSCVSAATGRIDGMVLLLGVFFGIFLFGETFDYFGEFLFSTPLYRISIPEYFSAPQGLIVFVVTIIAIAGFIGAKKVEDKFSKQPVADTEYSSIKNVKPNLWFGSIAFVIAVIFLFAGDPVKNKFDSNTGEGIFLDESGMNFISADELAELIMSRNDEFLLVDMRGKEVYDKYHIPGAVSFDDGIMRDSSKNKIIFYSQSSYINENNLNGLKNIYGGELSFLLGGINYWYSDILFPDLTIPSGMSPELITKKEKRSRFFGGKPKVRLKRLDKGKKYSREGC